MRMRGTLLGAVVVVAVLAVAVAPSRMSPSASAASTDKARRSYALPSNGWKPGEDAMLALTGGAFHAKLEPTGACAWLGSGDEAYTWPAGYRVRLHPTVLLDARGRVVAKEGDVVQVGGGGSPSPVATRCAAAGQWTWQVQSKVPLRGVR
jgi:hypothetical protein